MKQHIKIGFLLMVISIVVLSGCAQKEETPKTKVTVTPQETNKVIDVDKTPTEQTSEPIKKGIDADLQELIEKANDLKQLGLEVDWREHSWLKLYDMARRIRKANNLKRLGMDVNWRKHSYLDMIEMGNQIRRRAG